MRKQRLLNFYPSYSDLQPEGVYPERAAKRIRGVYAGTNRSCFSILAIAGYAIVIAIVFGTALFPAKDQLIFGDDIHRSYNFFRQFFGESLREGTFPWWNPYLFSGEPFIANPSLSFWYPPNWLFVVLPHTVAYSWIIAFHVFVAMAGMYFLARRFLPLLPAWTCGVVFGLSGYFTARLYAGHSDILTSAPYLPIVFGLFWIAMEKKTPRLVVFAGAALALQIYAGYPTTAFFTMEAVGVACVAFCMKSKSLAPLGIVVAATIIGLGLSSLQLIPAQEFFRRSIRTFPLPYSWAVAGASQLDHYAQLVNPFYLGDQYAFRGFPGYAEYAAYIGKAPLFFALLAVIAAVAAVVTKKKRGVALIIVLAFVALFSLWVSMAWYAPVDLQYILWKFVPFYGYMRIPSRHLILFVFSASMLSGFGLSLIRGRLLQIVLVAIVLADLIPFAKRFVVTREVPERRHDQKLVAAIKNDPGLYRYLPNFSVATPPRDSLDFDAAMSYRIFSASGYDPSILRNYYEFVSAVNQVENIDIQQNDVQIPPLMMNTPYTDMLNIKYLLVNSWIDLAREAPNRFRLQREDQVRQYRLYENLSVMPRFFIVPRVKVLPDRQAVASAIRNRTDDPKTTVLTADTEGTVGFAPDCTSHDTMQVDVVSYTVNQMKLATRSSCNAFLTSSEVMYPGWEATIDGKSQPLFEGNLAFRTLYLSKGEHTVVMEYQPRIFYRSILISIFTGAVSLFWVTRKVHNAKA